MRERSAHLPRLIAPFALALGLLTPAARADDLASLVARARELVESGSYDAALRTLGGLPANLPPALAVEAALLETTASLVTKTPEAGEAACGKAIAAAGYDPEVARDQSPKVRTACRTAASKVRAQRLAHDKVTFEELEIERPEIAWKPVRIEAKVSTQPPWLRAVARVTSSALEGSFDLALAPSIEGPLRGTLDASWIRPGAKIQVKLVAQDRFGDLGVPLKETSFDVPSAEAAISIGDVPSDAIVRIDGAATKLGPQGVTPVSPGKHSVELELDDGASARTSVDVKRGAVSRVALSPQKAAAGRTLAWISTGATVALGAVGGVLLLTANSRKKDIEDAAQKREPNTSLPLTQYSDIASLDRERKTLTTAGTAFLIAGGVTAVAAVTLWLWPEKRASPAKTKTGGATVTPFAGPFGIGAAGSF